MPEEAEKQALKELARLERTPEASAEHSMIRSYLDWLIELPWSKLSEERIDIAEARRILDEDHYGLPKIKQRILEYLAVRKLKPEGKSPILCFVGPPGGQTLARPIDRARHGPQIRAAELLGGLHDEAEIRGHRRTYIGALPGNVIQRSARLDAQSGDDARRDGQARPGIPRRPSAACLEVLDPEQNSTFRDNYLAVPFDLSRVMFVGTANVIDTIPGPLRDRMEIIELPGYTEEEKVEIAKRYLLKRQLEATGLTPALARSPTTRSAPSSATTRGGRRPQSRARDRRHLPPCRHPRCRRQGGAHEDRCVRSARDPRQPPLRERSRHAHERPRRVDRACLDPTGGDILFVECARVPGSGRLILTGQLGDVMKESACRP